MVNKLLLKSIVKHTFLYYITVMIKLRLKEKSFSNI